MLYEDIVVANLDNIGTSFLDSVQSDKVQPLNVGELLIILQLLGFTKSEDEESPESPESQKSKSSVYFAISLTCSLHKERVYKLRIPTGSSGCSCIRCVPGTSASYYAEEWYPDRYFPLSSISEKLITFTRLVSQVLIDLHKGYASKVREGTSSPSSLKIYLSSISQLSYSSLETASTYSEPRPNPNVEKVKQHLQVALEQINKGMESLDIVHYEFPHVGKEPKPITPVKEPKTTETVKEEKQQQKVPLYKKQKQILLSPKLRRQSQVDITTSGKKPSKLTPSPTVSKPKYSTTQQQTPSTSRYTQETKLPRKQDTDSSKRQPAKVSFSEPEKPSPPGKEAKRQKTPLTGISGWIRSSFKSKQKYGIQHAVTKEVKTASASKESTASASKESQRKSLPEKSSTLDTSPVTGTYPLKRKADRQKVPVLVKQRSLPETPSLPSTSGSTAIDRRMVKVRRLPSIPPLKALESAIPVSSSETGKEKLKAQSAPLLEQPTAERSPKSTEQKRAKSLESEKPQDTQM